jgi:hypothetical protein
MVKSILTTPSGMWETYEIKCEFCEDIYGGKPANKELIDSWIKAKTGYDDEATKVQIKEAKELLEETEAEAEELRDSTYNIFLRDDNGLYIECRQVKAMLRECFSVLQIFVKQRGTKQIFQHALEVESEGAAGNRIYLGVKKPTGIIEQAIHVDTAQGKRSALKACEYVSGAQVMFRIKILATAAADKRHISEEMLKKVLVLAESDGLGASRSQGIGKFKVIGFKKL